MKSDVIIVLRSRFPIRCDSRTFKAEIGIFMFAWIFRTFWPKMAVMGAKRGRGGVMLTLNKLVLTFGVVTSVPLLTKIDQEMQPWECRQTDRQTDRHAVTETNWFRNLCRALCIVLGQIIRFGTLVGLSCLKRLDQTTFTCISRLRYGIRHCTVPVWYDSENLHNFAVTGTNWYVYTTVSLTSLLWTAVRVT